MATGYEPLDTLKPVAPGLCADIWIVDGPPVRFYGAAFPTRATIIRLKGGGLWVHSPTRLSEDLAGAVEALGPVRHLVAPNWIHYAYIGDWHARFPEAETWAAPGVEARAARHGMRLHFDHALSGEAPAAWAGEIGQMIVRGSRLHREAVFFHRASRSLILTDLIENFEAQKLPWYLRPLARLAGVLDPDGKAPLDMRLSFRRGRREARADVERMIAWAPERVILAHGRWYPRDGVAELRRAFRWLS